MTILLGVYVDYIVGEFVENMKTLILLANGFPYGKWEPYLETEINYYKEVFDHVYVCSLQIRKEFKDKRPVPEKFEIIPVYYAPGYVYILFSLFVLFDRNLYAEVFKLQRARRLSFKRIVSLFVFLSRSHYEASLLLKYFKKKGINKTLKNAIIYSYRLEYQSYVGILLKKEFGCQAVARAHGYDLYEKRRETHYIPLREFLLNALDKVILISQNGVDYLANLYPAYKDKLTLSRLGTLAYPMKKTEFPKNKELNLVSCSNIVSVKRIHLLVEALSEIQEVSVKWTHYGHGVLFDEILKLCKEVLPTNVVYEFKGHIDNKSLLEEYRTQPYHLFINVSSSEGVPVSIIEAMSFGIPCIATNVGGTCEIVVNRFNGILLEENFKTETLAKHIREFASMSNEAYQGYCEHARKSWIEGYSADNNYRSFMTLLDNICCKNY